MKNIRTLTERELYSTMIAELQNLVDSNDEEKMDKLADDYEGLENELDRRFYAELTKQLAKCNCGDDEKHAILQGFDQDATWHLDALTLVKSIDELQTIQAAVAEYLGRERTVYADTQTEETFHKQECQDCGKPRMDGSTLCEECAERMEA